MAFLLAQSGAGGIKYIVIGLYKATSIVATHQLCQRLAQFCLASL
jgi:hypothetical protein